MSDTPTALDPIVSETASETLAAVSSTFSTSTTSSPLLSATTSAATATATSTSSSSSGSSSVSIGAIIGLIVGALSLVALGVFFVILRRRYLRKLGITDSEAHLHEVTERSDPNHPSRPRPATIIEIRTGRRSRRPRSEQWVEPPPTYQEAHADGIVPAYEENDSGSDREHGGAGGRSPLRSPARSLHLEDFHLQSPLSIRSLRLPRSPRSPRTSRTPGSRTLSSLSIPMRSPMRSPDRSPVIQVDTVAEFDEGEARARLQV